MLQQSVAYYCSKCGVNEFTLQAGSLLNGLINDVECNSDCPYGADCSLGGSDLLAQSGYFGTDLPAADRHANWVPGDLRLSD